MNALGVTLALLACMNAWTVGVMRERYGWQHKLWLNVLAVAVLLTLAVVWG